MLVLSLLLSGVSAAQPATPGCLPTVEAGWIRLPPMAMPMLAGFATLRNGCAASAVVVAASSPSFASVELHESTVVDGVSRMRPVPRLQVAAGRAAVLEPGGLHLMLMDPRSPLAAGQRIEVVFTLEDGSRVRGMFEARPAG